VRICSLRNETRDKRREQGVACGKYACSFFHLSRCNLKEGEAAHLPGVVVATLNLIVGTAARSSYWLRMSVRHYTAISEWP
jgi:hypothetical protein